MGSRSVKIELHFKALAKQPIPADHGYAVMGAVTQIVPSGHAGDGFAIAPIAGMQVGNRMMALTQHSRLILRLEAERIHDFLSLAGKSIRIGDRYVMLGTPTVHPIMPADTVKARLVTIKGFFEPAAFAEAAKRQLEKIGVTNANVTLGRQRTISIKRNEILGFETTVSGLDGDSSIIVQSEGIGGRRHMGCGVFVPHGGSKALTGGDDGEES
jgi:CRISPR-associated endonuclease/helicase Cas3